MTIEYLPGYKTESAEIVTVEKRKKKQSINISLNLLSTDYVLSHLIGVLRRYTREKRPGFLRAVL